MTTPPPQKTGAGEQLKTFGTLISILIGLFAVVQLVTQQPATALLISVGGAIVVSVYYYLKRRRFLEVFVAWIGVIVIVLAIFVLFKSATVAGTVVDENGAPVPNTEVVLIDANGVTHNGRTNNAGEFVFPSVPIGLCQLRVQNTKIDVENGNPLVGPKISFHVQSQAPTAVALATPAPTLTPTITVEPTNTQAPPPPVSLVSLRYGIDDYDPRMVDLRTAASSGIPASVGRALRLFDLFVSVPADAPEYKVQAEIYVNNEIIGATRPTPLLAGTIKLDDVEIEKHSNGKEPPAWIIQPEWKDLQVFLVTYHEGEPVDRNLTTIHLNPGGTAWLIDPPNMNLASLVYTINDGPEIVLDLRNAESAGLRAKANDKLTLKEIWYHSNATSGQTAYVEASLLAEGEVFDSATYRYSDRQKNIIQSGINKLDLSPFTWTIPSNKRVLDLTLYRNDSTVMDMLILPLGSQN